MGVDHLPRGRSQPFYHALADVTERPFESSVTYVAEDNVEPVGATIPVLHPMVEQVFSSFVPGAGYLPTAGLRADYPEDVLPDLVEDEYLLRIRREAKEGAAQEEMDAAARQRARARVQSEMKRVSDQVGGGGGRGGRGTSRTS